MALALCLFMQTAAGSPTEDQLKAAFIYNFPGFYYTTDTDRTTTAYFDFCVSGITPISELLTFAIEGQQINGKQGRVIQLQDEERVDRCHLLFISNSSRKKMATLLRSISDAPVLTVSDIDGSAEEGVIIELKPHRGKMMLIINTDNAEQAGLKIKANLLKLSKRIVNPPGHAQSVPRQ